MESRAGVVERIANGEYQALESLMTVMTPRLTNTVRLLVKDRGRAEDVVQEVWVRLWLNAGKIQSDAHLKKWLFMTAHNRAIDYLRRVYLHREVPGGMSAEETAERLTLPGPEVAYMAGSEAQQILDLLPDVYRDTLILRAQGVEYADIARRYNIPVGTVKSRLAYATKRARALAVQQGWEEARELA